MEQRRQQKSCLFFIKPLATMFTNRANGYQSIHLISGRLSSSRKELPPKKAVWDTADLGLYRTGTALSSYDGELSCFLSFQKTSMLLLYCMMSRFSTGFFHTCRFVPFFREQTQKTIPFSPPNLFLLQGIEHCGTQR